MLGPCPRQTTPCERDRCASRGSGLHTDHVRSRIPGFTHLQVDPPLWPPARSLRHLPHAGRHIEAYRGTTHGLGLDGWSATLRPTHHTCDAPASSNMEEPPNLNFSSVHQRKPWRPDIGGTGKTTLPVPRLSCGGVRCWLRTCLLILFATLHLRLPASLGMPSRDKRKHPPFWVNRPSVHVLARQTALQAGGKCGDMDWGLAAGTEKVEKASRNDRPKEKRRSTSGRNRSHTTRAWARHNLVYPRCPRGSLFSAHTKSLCTTRFLCLCASHCSPWEMELLPLISVRICRRLDAVPVVGHKAHRGCFAQDLLYKTCLKCRPDILIQCGFTPVKLVHP